MAKSYKQMWQEEKDRADRYEQQLVVLLAEAERTAQVVDLGGIAAHMKVERLTPQQWRQRGLLPPVDFPDIKEPLWYVSTIKQQFVNPTRRVWYDRIPDEVSPAA